MTELTAPTLKKYGRCDLIFGVSVLNINYEKKRFYWSDGYSSSCNVGDKFQSFPFEDSWPTTGVIQFSIQRCSHNSHTVAYLQWVVWQVYNIRVILLCEFYSLLPNFLFITLKKYNLQTMLQCLIPNKSQSPQNNSLLKTIYHAGGSVNTLPLWEQLNGKKTDHLWNKVSQMD